MAGKNLALLAMLCLGEMAFISARFANVNFSFGLTVAEDSHRLSEDMVRICAKDTDVSMEELTQLRQHHEKGVMIGSGGTVTSEATKCFLHCMYEQMGLMHDGVFVERDYIGTVGTLTDPMFHLFKQCHTIQAENKCEKAFRIHQCMHEAKISRNNFAVGRHGHGHGLHRGGAASGESSSHIVPQVPPQAQPQDAPPSVDVKNMDKINQHREVEYPTAAGSVPLQYELDD